jgi:hypothetical protein
VGSSLTLPPTALTAAATALLLMLLTWLLVLLALLILSLALIGGGMHAGATAIRLCSGLVAIAAYGGAGLVAPEPASAFIVTDLVLDPSVATDQAAIAVAASVGHIRPVAVVPVVGLVAGVVAVPVVVVPVSIVIVVIAVPVDVVPGDVGVVVVVDVSPTASTTPIHAPCSETPPSTEAPGYEAAAPANGRANRYPSAEGQTGCNGDRRRIGRHHQGRAIDNCRVVLRNINHVTGGGFDDDGLRALLHYLDLRRRL